LDEKEKEAIKYISIPALNTLSRFHFTEKKDLGKGLFNKLMKQAWLK
jgi:hypothetical protein